MPMLAEFIRLITQHIDRAIYVWGGQGQVVTSETQIRRMEQSVGDADRAIALWHKRQAAGIDPVYMFDCSGLIIWALQTMKLIDYDTTADGLKRLSKPTTSPRVGDFAFKVNADGRAYHVGTVTRPGYVTEAKGRDYGVVERLAGASWSAFGTNPFIDTNLEVSDLIYVQYGDGRQTTTSSDPAVRSMQEGLAKLDIKMTNNNVDYSPDGRYGTATENGVLAFKAKYNLPGDGKTFDRDCLRVMLTQLAALETGVPQAEVDAIKADLAEEVRKSQYLVGQIETQKQIVVGLNADILTVKGELTTTKAALVASEQYAAGRQAELDRANSKLTVIRKGYETAMAGP